MTNQDAFRLPHPLAPGEAPRTSEDRLPFFNPDWSRGITCKVDKGYLAAVRALIIQNNKALKVRIGSTALLLRAVDGRFT
jgi:hypothetical protein